VNLIIEQGNTLTKVAIFENRQIEALFSYEDFNSDVIEYLFEQYNLKQGILSSVIHVEKNITDSLLQKLSKFIFLDETVSLPIEIAYETPDTLGKDRLAAAVGANFLEPNKDILVIDAGTAITYEFIESSGIYIGGNISPGMTTRFKALNYYTQKLPLVSEPDVIPLLGSNTISAIQAGVVNGIVYEMDGYINDLRLKYPNLLVFLTGGHSFYFERRLKNCIFANINLVLTGLNRILEYNVEN